MNRVMDHVLDTRDWELRASGSQVVLYGKVVDTTAGNALVLEHSEPIHTEVKGDHTMHIVLNKTHLIAGTVTYNLNGNTVVLNPAFREGIIIQARIKLMEERLTAATMNPASDNEKVVLLAAFITTQDGLLLREGFSDAVVKPGMTHQVIWNVDGQQNTWNFVISDDDLPTASVIVPEAVPMRIPRALVGVVERLKARMLPELTVEDKTRYSVHLPKQLQELPYPSLEERRADPAWHQSVVSKSLEINAAHWLPPHEGKCRFVHGHNYTFDVKVRGWYHERGQTNRDFFVVEFATLNDILKETVGSWDHMILAHYTNEELDDLLPYTAQTRDEYELGLLTTGGIPEFGISRNKIISIGVWTTAENLSRVAAESIMHHLDQLHPEKGLQVEVTCWETPRTSATSTVNSKFFTG